MSEDNHILVRETKRIQQWIVENVFSCMKRMVEEYVSAIRFENMINEIMIKASCIPCFKL